MSHTIVLSDEELAELERVLAYHAENALVEIHRTDNRGFRRELQKRHQLEERILHTLQQAWQPAAAG